MQKIKRVNLLTDTMTHSVINIMVFGSVLFYCGLYILPDVSDMARIFYILIMLPMLIIFFKVDKFYLKDKYFWLLMLLPIYLTVSHFWADEDYVTKSAFFHFRKVIYILFYLAAIFFIVKKIHGFSRLLFQSVLIAGTISSVISLLCFFSGECGVIDGRLSSFSVQDINKASAMYAIHMGICSFFLTAGFKENKKNSLWLNFVLTLSLLLSGVAVFYTETDATAIMFLIILFFLFFSYWTIKRIYILMITSIGVLGVFLYFDGYSFLMQDASFKTRLVLNRVSWEAIENNIVFGVGMTHKLPLLGYPHPHNIFADVLRFGGLIGFLVLLGTVIVLFVKGLLAIDSKTPMVKLCLACFIASIAIMMVYAQQPVTRPGGYIWFLYWMPGTLLAAELSRLDSVSCEEEVAS